MNTSMTMLSAAPPAIARPHLMPLRRVIYAYYSEAKYEFVRTLRTPAFAVPFLVLPVAIYLLFGVVFGAPAIAKNPAVGDYLFSGFSVFGIAGPALFGAGVTLAMERDAGLVRLKRALPAPPGAYILAKLMLGMLFATLVMITLVITALLVGKVTLSLPQLLALSGVMVLGTLPICALGLFVGAHTSGSASPAFANLVFLPMLWLSGLFIPLPPFLQKWAVIWPAFHLNQVAMAVIGLKQFTFMPVTICLAVLLGVTVLFGGLAVMRLMRAQ